MRLKMVLLAVLAAAVLVLVGCGGAEAKTNRPSPTNLGGVMRCLERQHFTVSTRPNDFDLVADALIDEGMQVAVVTHPGEVQIAIDPDHDRILAATNAWGMWIRNARQIVVTRHAVAAFSFPPTRHRRWQVEHCLPA